MLQIQPKTVTVSVLGWSKALIAAVAAIALTMGLFATVNATNVSGCDFDDTVAGTWSLQGDCTTTGPINVSADTILEGNGYTINGGYAFGSNGAGTNTVIGVINANNVTIRNLTIDGTNGTALHGINVFNSNDVSLSNVTTKNNDKSGVVVNSSQVTVSNLTTEGNGWHGVNVDKRVANPASLTINGVSKHNELLQVYVDDVTKASVIDTNDQYGVTNPQIAGRVNDALYTLKPVEAKTKDDCKNAGYLAYGFKNQGQCVSFVVASEKASFKRS